MDEKRTIAREEFLRLLRDSLNNLYNAVHLRQSPLAGHFGVANRFDTASALRNILIEAIDSLKPAADEPAHSRAWRIYDALSCCYVQQLSQEMAADQLGLSARQLRRELHIALEVLADRLHEQFDLGTRLHETGSAQAAPQPAETAPTLSEELAWLKDMPPEKPTTLRQALPAVLDLARPLAAQHGVQVETRLADPYPDLAAHPLAVEQALLSVLSVAMAQAGGNPVQIAVRSLRWDVEIEVRGATSPQPLSESSRANLDTARQLAALCGGRLAVSDEAEAFSATLTFPAVGQVPVLAVDDNADTLQLLQRYATNTRYRLVGTRDPEQAFSLAEKLSPQIIVLDVMMPQQDGWKMLARLRQHPLTGDIPIVVCTVLAQEALALSLGASDFVRKPVTRQSFLAALDRQVALIATAPR